MQKFLLDTGIVLGYARGVSYAEYVDQKFKLFNHVNTPLVSVVSKGELYSLAIQFSWGPNKLKLLNELLRKLPIVDINDEQIIGRYAEIDAYSLSKDSSKPLPKGQTARQMGKNDLWIAATASALRATLLTTDHDFDHLNTVFIDVVYIDPKLTASDV
ncbi:MAG TPA: type II toxin-antitoxin system VapC family toxin [Pyrinomonadaceae bacterium]|nr:type II toxin-antitoxin system VapC family toxin [Pyrinomonadaceae bacterium]